MLFCHNELNAQHVLETSETCCEKRCNNQSNQKPLLEGAHCLDTTHIRERLLAGRVEKERRLRSRGVQHRGRVVRDESHGH